MKALALSWQSFAKDFEISSVPSLSCLPSHSCSICWRKVWNWFICIHSISSSLSATGARHHISALGCNNTVLCRKPCIPKQDSTMVWISHEVLAWSACIGCISNNWCLYETVRFIQWKFWVYSECPQWAVFTQRGMKNSTLLKLQFSNQPDSYGTRHAAYALEKVSESVIHLLG